MPNAWTTHVREFAKKNNMTYMCALSTPECSASYKKPEKTKRKRLSQNAEREMMGFEEEDTRAVNKQRKAKLAESKMKLGEQKAKLDVARELSKMGVEDIKSALIRQAHNIVLPHVPSVASPVAPPVKSRRGRPKKYEDAETARKAKIANTITAAKRRQAEKREAKAKAKAEKEAKKTEKRGRPRKGGKKPGDEHVGQKRTYSEMDTGIIRPPQPRMTTDIQQHTTNLIRPIARRPTAPVNLPTGKGRQREKIIYC